MPNRILYIDLTLDEGNLILEALAECAFKSVFELIGKLTQQANDLFAEDRSDLKYHKFSFTERDMTLIIKALGDMPYNRVHSLLASLNRQIQMQLSCQHPDNAPTAYAEEI